MIEPKFDVIEDRKVVLHAVKLSKLADYFNRANEEIYKAIITKQKLNDRYRIVEVDNEKFKGKEKEEFAEEWIKVTKSLLRKGGKYRSLIA